MATTGRIGKRGTVTIPVGLRRSLRLLAGSPVVAEAHGDGVLIRPVGAPAADGGLIAAHNAALAALSPPDLAALQAEHALWEGTLADGLGGEHVWEDDKPEL